MTAEDAYDPVPLKVNLCVNCGYALGATLTKLLVDAPPKTLQVGVSFGVLET